MVTFCTNCGTSLPYADMVISNGEESIASYYRCPECKQSANPQEGEEGANEDFELDEGSDLVIKQGECANQPAPADEPAENTESSESAGPAEAG